MAASGRDEDAEATEAVPRGPAAVAACAQAPAIDAYGGGGFRVAGERHEGSVLILDDQVAALAGR